MKIKRKYPLALLLLLFVTTIFIIVKIYHLYLFFLVIEREINDGVLFELFYIKFLFLPSLQLILVSIFSVGLLYRKKWSYRLLIILTLVYLFNPLYEFFNSGFFYLEAKTLTGFIIYYGLMAFLFLCIGSRSLKKTLSKDGGTIFYKTGLISVGCFFLIFFVSIIYLKSIDNFENIEIIEIDKNNKNEELPQEYKMQTSHGVSFPVPGKNFKRVTPLSGNHFLELFVEKVDKKIIRMVGFTDFPGQNKLLYPYLGVKTRTEFINCLISQDWSLFPLMFRRSLYSDIENDIIVFGDLNDFSLYGRIRSEPTSSVAVVYFEDHKDFKTHDITFGENSYTAVNKFITLMLFITKDVQPPHSHGRL